MNSNPILEEMWRIKDEPAQEPDCDRHRMCALASCSRMSSEISSALRHLVADRAYHVGEDCLVHEEDASHANLVLTTEEGGHGYAPCWGNHGTHRRARKPPLGGVQTRKGQSETVRSLSPGSPGRLCREGTVGDLVYVHRADGVVVVRRSAERKAKPSVAQNVNRSGFAISQLYVRRVKADPELYEPYQRAARIARKRACDLALADALRPPVIRDVDLSTYTGKAGEGIHIDAVDNFAIHSAHVRLDLIDGTLIEEGVAVFDIQLALWVYVTQSTLSPGTAVVVHVTALDRPGNAAIKTLHHVPAAV